MTPQTIAPEPTAATSEPPHPVETWGLGKTYRTGFWLDRRIESLKDCSLSVRQGETFGLLGPNGAGKTTLLKILLGIVRPTAGRAALLGRPIGDRTAKQNIGYLPENPYLYDHLTAWEFLEYIASLFGQSYRVTKARIPELLDMVGIEEATARKKQLRKYSKGMLQRTAMAQALMNDPDLVFLDEPMSGLDPLGRYQFRQIIQSLRDRGKTIFFNSHILGDVEQICDRVALLARGEILCGGSIEELLGTVEVYHVSGTGGDRDKLAAWVADLDYESGFWSGTLQKGNPQQFLSALADMGANLREMRLARASLEEFFVQQMRQRGITSSR
ncbi:MAG: ABC transporter ATP-binding protein [Cyanobacteria bacterium J06641_5]